MKHARLRSVLVILTMLLVGAVSLFAGTTGKIAGKVIDKETGFPLPSATVILVGTTLGAATDLNGDFFILNIPPGVYDVRASIIGYTPVIEKGVRVSVDLTTKVDFSMNSETLQLGDVVEVIAERPLIQKDVTASTKITTSEEIKALPVVTINEAIALTAGTQGSGSNLHIRGGRAGEVAFLVDGLNIQDPLDRSLGLTVGTSAVSELQIISGGFNAEYGDAQSGVIQLTTQEGKRERYTGRISYQTDHFGDSGISNSTQGFDRYDATLSGPEPITTHILPKLGLKIPGYMTLFAQGESILRNGSGFHADALKEAGEPKFYGTSNILRNEPFYGTFFGIGNNREDVRANWNGKLVWQMAPNKKFTLGWRGNHDDINPRSFVMGLDLDKAVRDAQLMGINDARDNDGDGRIDEEIFDGRDDDGDGVIDENDAILDSRYDFTWYVDNDGDGRIDEEASNGIDDDGDGQIDEDLQPYRFNGYDAYVRTESRNNQLVMSWTHTLNPKTFYEVRLGRFSTQQRSLPKYGKDGVSRSSFNELEGWVQEYVEAQAIIDRARAAGQTPPDIEDLIEPYRGFGDPSEPFADANNNNAFDVGESFTDWDGDGMWDRNFGNRTNPIWIFTGQANPYRGQRFNGRYWVTDRAGFSKEISNTYFLKFDMTSQVTTHHQIKGGFEVNYFDLDVLSRQLINPYNGLGLFANSFNVTPNWQAAYIQDKMEYSSAILNFGLRVERFDQGEQVATQDTSSPFIPRYEVPSAKFSFLPRIAFSFPVTASDKFYFNYGRFFQRPRLDYVFDTVNQAIASSNSIVGNPNLDPEETIAYEFGIEHQFGMNTLLNVKGFFKDINNLLQINRRFDDIGNAFYTYFNDSYGTVKGLEFELQQRSGRFFSGGITYTFQVAKSSHSGAADTYTNENIFAALPGVEYAADWDQRHRIVVNVDYHYGDNQGPRLGNFFPLENWNVNVLAQYGSGTPYTPQSLNGTDQLELTNTLRYPSTFDIDVNMRRFFNLTKGTRFGATLQVLNLLNRRNVIGGDNGGILDRYRHDTLLNGESFNGVGYVNTSSANTTRNYGGYANSVPNPAAWSNGRIIRLGFFTEF